MIKNYYFILIAIFAFAATSVVAQDGNDNMMAGDSQEMMEEDQSNVFTPKPKNMWEVGIQGGHMFVSGDVDPALLGGFGVGLHVRKAINYTLSFRVDFDYGQATGYDARDASGSILGVEGYDIDEYNGERFYRNYKAEMFQGSLLGVVNIGNILFHKPENKWNLYVLAGLGLYQNTTSINAFDGDDPYDFSPLTTDNINYNPENRRENRDRLKNDILDDDFETEARQEPGVFALNEDNSIHFNYQFGVGLTRKISDRFNIGLEHKVIGSGNDKLDGFRFRNSGDLTSQPDLTNSPDIINYTTIHLNFNIGSEDNRTEPLYWVNPLKSPLEDLAEVKARPVLDLTDSDEDGVIDEWDMEEDTPEGVAVNVRGEAMDTDGDGIPDHKDKEMFSLSGYDVDEDGVAINDDPYVTESQVKDMINNRLDEVKVNWFLPMIHFDLDKYYVKPEFVSSLRHVADVVKNNPSIKVAVKGYADNRAADDYNKVLSYNRAEAAIDYLVENFGVDRNRFIIQYGGESNPLIPGLPESYNISKEKEYLQYMNRRVEFSVAGPDDQSMSKPEGPEAGSATPGSSRSGSKYSGNRNSGY